MGRAGAFFQGALFAVAAVLLRLANADGSTKPFHPNGLITIVSIAVGLSILIRFMNSEPFQEVPPGHPRWRLNDYQRRRKHPKRWAVAQYVAPFEWVVTIAVLVWLFAVRQDKRPVVRIDAINANAVPVIQHVLLVAVLALALVYLSTLVDLMYVHPRVRGGHWGGAVQCVVDGFDGAPNSGNWLTVTKIWLLHRFIAQVGIILSLALGVALILGDRGVPVANPLGGAVATVFGGLYFARVFPVFLFILNPAMSIGDSVELAEEYTVRRPFPLYFVVDVSLEGIKLFAYKFLPAPPTEAAGGARERPGLFGWRTSVADRPGAAARITALDAADAPLDGRVNRTHDRVLNPADAGRLLRNRHTGKPCQSLNRCTHVNRYCPVVVALEQHGGNVPSTAPAPHAISHPAATSVARPAD